MLNTNKLASENKLSRKTLSVTRDTKRNQLIITHEVTQGVLGEEGYRSEITYHLSEDTPTDNINSVLDKVRREATLSFLGLEEEEEEEVKPKSARKSKAVTKAKEEPKPEPKPEPIEEPKEAAVEEEAKPKPVKKKVARKKKAAALRSVPKEEPVVEEEGPELDLGDPLLDDAPNEKYQKGNTNHAQHLQELIEAKYGKQWRKDTEVVATIKALVGRINNRVEVVNSEGTILPTFIEYVNGYLAKAA
jgi:hypothetical protein